MKKKIQMCLSTLLVLLIAVGVVCVVNVNSNDVESIAENQQIIHEVANYARASNFKNQTLIVEKLSEIWTLLEEEKTYSSNIIDNLLENKINEQPQKGNTTNEYVSENPSNDQNIPVSNPDVRVEVSNEHRYSQIAANITQYEKDIIAKLTFLEARGESDEGQRAVIEVILNRVLNGSFPNTIEGVIYQNNPIQFSPSGHISSTSATPKEYSNVDYVLSGQSFITDSNVVFFSTGLQSGRKLFKKIGNHYFQYL